MPRELFPQALYDSTKLPVSVSDVGHSVHKPHFREDSPAGTSGQHGEIEKVRLDLTKPSRTSMVAGFSVAFCWTARPPTGRHNFRMLISRAGRRCSSRYSRYGVSTSSIHFMNARTRRDRLLRCATTRDTASARRRKSGMISTSAPLSKYRPIPKSGA